ncbi:hypothetical protein Tco_1191650 [Tanacetum coccineum]
MKTLERVFVPKTERGKDEEERPRTREKGENRKRGEKEGERERRDEICQERKERREGRSCIKREGKTMERKRRREEERWTKKRTSKERRKEEKGGQERDEKGRKRERKGETRERIEKRGRRDCTHEVGRRGRRMTDGLLHMRVYTTVSDVALYLECVAQLGSLGICTRSFMRSSRLHRAILVVLESGVGLPQNLTWASEPLFSVLQEVCFVPAAPLSLNHSGVTNHSFPCKVSADLVIGVWYVSFPLVVYEWDGAIICSIVRGVTIRRETGIGMYGGVE